MPHQNEHPKYLGDIYLAEAQDLLRRVHHTEKNWDRYDPLGKKYQMKQKEQRIIPKQSAILERYSTFSLVQHYCLIQLWINDYDLKSYWYDWWSSVSVEK